jgi:predicted metallopeptidase
MLKVPLHCSFRLDLHELRSKEGVGVKSLECKGQMKSAWSVLYTVEKIFSRAIRYNPLTFKVDLIRERYEHLKF